MKGREKENIVHQDVVGVDTLTAIGKADQFNKWMFETIKPFCQGSILEIGSGIGNISSLLLKAGFPTVLSDFNTQYCDQLKHKFKWHNNCLGIRNIDLVDPNFASAFSKQMGSFDTIIALNVIEHIEDDVLALNNCRMLLKPGGRLIILVPSYQKLYNVFDKGLGHYRRYNKATLSRIFEQNDFSILHKQYFNFVGILGWYVSGSIFKNEQIPKGQMSLYNFFVPLIKIVDRLLFNKIGLSTIVIGKK